MISTPHTEAANAAERWKYNYGPQWQILANGVPSIDVYNKLVLLGESPEPEAVDAVIGNKSWTRCKCHNCGKAVDATVIIGQALDYESSTADICQACLTEALKEFK